MIVKILREFYDKDNLKHLFKIGEEVEFADNRAMDIISRGLGECVNKEVVQPAAEEKPAEVAAEAKEEEPLVEEKVEAEVKEEVPETPIRRRGRPARN